MKVNPKVKPPNHKVRARLVWPILVGLAKAEKPPLTYGQLSGMLGLHPRSAQWFLGVIQAYCKNKNMPPLQALVVSKATGVPGPGYIGSSRSPAKHAQAVADVHKYGNKWTTVAPRF